MNRKLIVLLLSVAVCACSSDTKQLDAYLKNNYPEYQIVEDGEIVTDQIRTVDKSRLKKKITTLSPDEQAELQDVLRQMFCE